MSQHSLSATVFRGGTSKGVYVERSEMPADLDTWDALLLEAFGSPDPMQLNGIGGSHSTTSKAMIVSESTDPDVDVEYRFGQVGVDNPVVDWGGNCGNLTFAVGPFALERGITTPSVDDGRTDLVLQNTNTGTVVAQSIPIGDDGLPDYRGDFRVYGVPGTGGRIRSRFLDPGGSETGTVFPTGNRVDVLEVPGIGDVEASLVDVSSPCVFVRASDVGLTATEIPEEINGDPDVLDRLERIRSAACAAYGFVDDAGSATAKSPGIPKLAFVGEREAYEKPGGGTVSPDEYSLLARIMSMQKAHHAYAVTGSMCTAVAALLSGTIPNEFYAGEGSDIVTIGHPKGTLSVDVDLDGTDVEATAVDRTARSIMAGDLFYLSDY